MLVRLSVSIGALFGLIALAASARADAFVVDGVVHLDGRDARLLDYAPTYPLPSPAHSQVRGYPHPPWYAGWGAWRRSAHGGYRCILSDGPLGATTPC